MGGATLPARTAQPRWDGTVRRALLIGLLVSACADAPTLETVTPAEALVESSVVLSGQGFGAERAPSSHLVVFTLDSETRLELDSFVDSWSPTEIAFTLPGDFLGPARDRRSFGIHVERGAISNCLAFDVILPPDPRIAAISPPAAEEGSEIRLDGMRFGETAGRVIFSPDVVAEVTSWADGAIVVNVPNAGADGRTIRVETALGLISRPYSFAIADPTRPTLSLLQATIFTPRCSLGPCHSGVRAADLSLADGQSYSNLVSVASSQLAGAVRVAPFDSAASLLVDKLENDPPVVGVRMPLDGPYLSAEEAALVRAWIDGGAMND